MSFKRKEGSKHLTALQRDCLDGLISEYKLISFNPHDISARYHRSTIRLILSDYKRFGFDISEYAEYMPKAENTVQAGQTENSKDTISAADISNRLEDNGKGNGKVQKYEACDT